MRSGIRPTHPPSCSRLQARAVFQSFYDEMAAVTSSKGAAVVQAKYGMTFHAERIPGLMERHHLFVHDPHER